MTRVLAALHMLNVTCKVVGLASLVLLEGEMLVLIRMTSQNSAAFLNLWSIVSMQPGA